jgi:hypothetical protein
MRVASIISSALLFACTACASSFPRPPCSPQPTSALVEVALPPPPARVELVPARPSASALWIDGEWTWRRGRWAWLVGRWVDAPAAETFSPWVFVRAPDGTLFYAPGVWRDARGGPVDPPATLAIATVESGEVVDADGTAEVTGPTLRERPRARSSGDP